MNKHIGSLFNNFREEEVLLVETSAFMANFSLS